MINNVPSAFINFSQKTLAIYVWAARDIEPGEEITITCRTPFSIILCSLFL